MVYLTPLLKDLILNSKDLLENLISRIFFFFFEIQTFDFSTLYTTLPHDILNSRLKGLTRKSFAASRNYVVLGYKSTYYSSQGG